jgi:tetratricopeptide (TPR) repeat protein
MSNYRLYPLTSAFYWVSGGVAVLLFALFLITMSSTVHYEDSGLFGMMCYYWGVAHPPSYPLYTLVCPPFAHIPFISPIHGVAIFSALNAAIACFFIALIVTRLSGIVWAGAIAALVYGVSDSLWSQAIIQEVYTFNVALFFLALWRVIEFSHNPNAKNFHWMIFLSILGLSNHWPLMVLSAVGFPLIIVSVWREFLRLIFSRHGIYAIGLALLALFPYAITWLRSLSNPEISFYGPIDSWNLFWFVISRKGYAGVDNAGGNLLDKQEYLLWLFESMVNEQVGWLGLALVPLGIYFLFKMRKWFLCGGIILAILGSSVFLTVLLDFKFSDFSKSIFRVYPLVSWGGISLLVGLGFAFLSHCYRRIEKKQGIKKRIWRYGAVYFLLIPAWLFAENYAKNNQPNITWAHKWSMAILQSLEKNAILFTHDDTHLPFMYLNVVEKVREDITIYNTQSLILKNRLTKAKVKLGIKKEKYRQVARNTSRPYYTFYEDENPYGGIWNGVFYKGDKSLKKGEKTNYLEMSFFDTLVDGEDVFRDNNGWSRNQRFKHARNLSKLLLQLPFDTPQHKKAREIILSAPFGQLSYASAWFEYRRPATEEDLAFELMQKVEPLVSYLPPYQQARYYSTYGRVQSVRSSRIDYKQVEELFLKGVVAYDWNDNPALYSLLELYAQTKNKELFDKYDMLYPNGARGSNIVAAYREGKDYRPPVKISKEEAKKMMERAISFLKNKPYQPDEALRIANELEEFYAHVADVSFIMGGARMMRREYNLAEQAFLRTLKLKPNHLNTQVNLLSIYLYEKKYERFEKLLAEALSKNPTAPRLLSIKSQFEKRKNQQ